MSKKQIQCSKGHFYNPDEYASCPRCNAEVNFGGMAATAENKTMPIEGGFVTQNGQPQAGVPVFDLNKTMPIDDSFIKVTDHEVTKPIAEDEYGFVPTVGWLVCIEGPEMGKDFSLKEKINTIGRDIDNDIVLTGDDRISGHQMKIGYDPRNAQCVLIQTGSSVIYLNGKSVFSQAELAANDIIEIYKVAKFLYIPLCSEKFNWSQITGGEAK